MGLFGRRQQGPSAAGSAGTEAQPQEQPEQPNTRQSQRSEQAEQEQRSPAQQQQQDPSSRVFESPLTLRHPCGAAGEAGGQDSPASSSIGVPTPASAAGTGSEFQTHLRKATADLLGILDQISSPAPAAKGAGPSWRSTHPGLADRGDSVATMADLEAGAPAVPAGGAGEAYLPESHVRRFTSLLTDVLRMLATPGGDGGEPGGDGQGTGPSESAPLTSGAPRPVPRAHCGAPPHHARGDSHALLADSGASEASFPATDSDKLSLASCSTGAGSGGADSASASTALLAAPFLRGEEEYRGDEVRPFYVDAPPDAVEDPPSPSKAKGEGGSIPHRLQKRRAVNPWGAFVFVAYLAAFGFYIYARAAYTLGLGSMLWYGGIVLAVEILGGLAMLPYGLCLCLRVTNGAPPPADPTRPAPPTALRYHVRVVIPCYKEPLEVVSKTLLAALFASLPGGCARTVYLLDDGKDPEKRKFVRSLGLSSAVYVSGRKRAKGEMNGKSANINSAMRALYPEDCADVPLTEVLCVFDADQVPNADFFLKTVPLLDGGQDVAMVLSPQTFYNLNADGDIFNHANVHFWDYTQPGYDALGLISCTGTNFLLRARAFRQAGWFPEWTLTEDFALGIELKKLGWQCRYVDEYLAIGEAPEEVRNCFQQRSRWSKGHFQVFFSRHNPIAGPGAKGLSPLMRWLYGSVVLSYLSAFTSTPLLMLVPMITVWFGSFPIVINFWAAVSITVYYAATLALTYYTRALGHLKSMWFASVSNSILWWAFLKAAYRASLGKFLAGTIVFKVTAKGLQRMKALPIRDVWVSLLFFLASLVTLAIGLVHFFRGPLDTPLAISLIFMVYNLVPQYLLLQYAVTWRRRAIFNVCCKLAMLLSTAAVVLGVVLVWVLYPRSYNYQQVLGGVMSFFDSQRVGELPLSNPIPYRGNAFVAEYNATAYLASALGNDTALGGSGFADTFAPFADPFSGRRLLQDPFGDGFFAPASGGGSSGGSTGSGGSSTGGFSPVGGGSAGGDPFAVPGAGGTDPFDPFSPATASPGLGGGGSAAAGPSEVAWDLGGGFLTGMSGGNIKATMPIAFTTTVLAWALMSFGRGFETAGQAGAALGSVRWGSDYLLKVHQGSPADNSSLLVTRVGDIDTEMLMWYRPEESPPDLPRPAYYVDAATGASDLGGSVAAALASSAMLFQSRNDSAYAGRLLDKAKEVYAFAKQPAPGGGYGRATDGDFNLTVLYNSSTALDDLAWAAAWLYAATKSEAYLADVYDFYVKHLADEAAVADWKYAFDWDNVFWPANVLLAQQTGKATFHQQTELFLRSWICANNAANFTRRGRAFNPMSGSLGATANAAMVALMYADTVESTRPDHAGVYKCWGLSQVRYVLGDAGRSLVVGLGKNPPRRTQDRAAACPDSPQVCNRVTGLLSPDPDAHVLTGALVYGSGFNDGFMDVRNSDSARVGIENNAGLAGAVAGAVELPDGLWEVCLQKYGIIRNNPVCGAFVNI